MDNQPVVISPSTQPPEVNSSSVPTPESEPTPPHLIKIKHAHKFIFGYIALLVLAAFIAGIYSWHHKTKPPVSASLHTNSTNTPTLKAATPIIGNGKYYDAPQSGPRYILTITAGQNGIITGNLVFQAQDGTQTQSFTYTADAYQSPFTCSTTTPATTSQVTATVSSSGLTLNNCQQYLQFIEASTTCNFTSQ